MTSNTHLKRAWLSTTMTVLFLAVGTSGTLMLFDLAPDAVEELHAVIGVAFTLAAVLHIVLNSRALMSYLRSKETVVVTLVAGLAVCGALLYAGTQDGEEDDENSQDDGDDQNDLDDRQGGGATRVPSSKSESCDPEVDDD